ncbi:VOC family protein [Sphingobium sp. H39-3-25]|jgi:catechol 2,3-dioxygenase|uniref:VOC family protein n=1 Tax=Sphingomonadales TaxID=204457 RepID=UPI000830AF3C|nr:MULTISPECIES: VOC family protein [Sphingomonadaceae]MDF0488866.1 VOC family protein [Sphingomonas pollutisoli]MDF0546671.1 VOC family protein [Sphingobium arseniciresistens]
MAVKAIAAVALDVPDVAPGREFYTIAGLDAFGDNHIARFRCTGQERDAIILYGGAPAKRLKFVRLYADQLEEISARVPVAGGAVIDAPSEGEPEGLWVRDPNGVVFHLVDQDVPELPPLNNAFEINAPGRTIRKNKAGVGARSSYPQVIRPVKLGHVALFSPDIPVSIAFLTDALGMGLADRSQDLVAFCCARKNSEHHVIALAKSHAIGFHHASFAVLDPDQVGWAGRKLVTAAGRADWGFGRHTIGSNFFHYIEDPWGSWFEYYSDMDYIEDHDRWTPTNYALEDSTYLWGPNQPAHFIHNPEVPAIVEDAPVNDDKALIA